MQGEGQSSLQQWQRRLSYYVYETVGQLRITEMFDIVVDYPDSRPAVQDVKDCLAHTNLHHKFVAGFKQAIGERLLHAGTICTVACMTGSVHQYHVRRLHLVPCHQWQMCARAAVWPAKASKVQCVMQALRPVTS